MSQFRIRERFRPDELEQCIAEQVGVVAVVEPEGDLVKVGWKVSDTEMMVRADDRALHIIGLVSAI